MKKKAFTIPELLMASGIFSVILAAGTAIMVLMSGTLYNGQVEASNRTSLNDIMFYLTREIQSAEKVRISDVGKTLEIKRHGDDGYNLKYSFVEHYPVDYMTFGNKKIIDVDYDKCLFDICDGAVKVAVSAVRNSIELNQRGRELTINVTPRSGCIAEEEE